MSSQHMHEGMLKLETAIPMSHSSLCPSALLAGSKLSGSKVIDMHIRVLAGHAESAGGVGSQV